ncbi:unnamed protein product [Rotaria sp. Silwood2]|nr:unnamed protein product [Rotaria sp. Silwood2]CAF4679869.1 unnamed protein product [Rotaria sp. Silwood2]
MQLKDGHATTAALLHMDENRHEKIVCQYGTECDSFLRLKESGYQEQDVAHCAIYFHPAHRIALTVEENIGSRKFISGYEKWGYSGRIECRVSTSLGHEGALISELNKNGFGHVMCLKGPYTSLNDVVHAKLKHPRHVRMGSPLSHDQMLAIILYTDTPVYADLRWDEILYCKQNPFLADQNWHHQKWPIFGALLDSAIRLLDINDDSENRPPIVYHGLKDIELDKSLFNNDGRKKSDKYFKYGTFVSTSWDKEVAISFIGGKGCLLVINTDEQPGSNKKLVGADVSWISKFTMECEFLIARKPTFEIIAMDFDAELNCQLVRVENGHNLYSNSD